jgi:hypothetical protein
VDILPDNYTNLREEVAFLHDNDLHYEEYAFGLRGYLSLNLREIANLLGSLRTFQQQEKYIQASAL